MHVSPLIRHSPLLFVIFLSLSACHSQRLPAPVHDGGKYHAVHRARPRTHSVRRGETLYAIAWHYDLDYRQLAKINHLSRDYHISPGQTLRLNNKRPGGKMEVWKQAKKRKPASPRKKASTGTKYRKKAKSVAILHSKKRSKSRPSKHWTWPTAGKVTKGYSKDSKGIDIDGHYGQAIKAVAAGKVVYSGTGLRGYGNLIIIKHNGELLSAYGHNRRVLVNEGNWVRAGQKIAEMGSSGRRHVMLHFEIRRAGKPVNPLGYLTQG